MLPGTHCASRFSESVVFRGEDDNLIVGTVHETSNGFTSVLVGERGDPGRVAGTAVDAGVRGQQFGDTVGDLGQCRRAGRVVEVGVGAFAALNQWNLQVGTRNLGNRGGCSRCRHSIQQSSKTILTFKDSFVGRWPRKSPRLPHSFSNAAGSSPGAPHRGGGLPTSKPGLNTRYS